MELEVKLNEALENIKSQVAELDKSAEVKATEIKTELEAKMDALAQELKNSAVSAEYVEKMQTQLDEMSVKMNQKTVEVTAEEVSFKAAFSNVAKEIVEKYGEEAKKTSDFKGSFEMKAAGNISFNNFGTGAYGMITTETLPGVYNAVPTPSFWLRSIFPNSSTTSETIQYLKYTGGEGAAAIWDEKAETLVEKPLVDADFVKASESVVWIAGIAHTHRGMLMDAPFLNTFIPQQLVYGDRGIMVAENAYIWAKIVANSTAYNGTKTIPVERIYDAAFGQLPTSYFNCTHILMNHRDVINAIAFNKAVGSGEYDLPAGTVTVVNGQLNINGVQVIASPVIAQGKFVALDNKVATFYNRMSPEVQMSGEHDKNFTKNMVTFRAEERVALAVYNSAGIIYGDLQGTTSTSV